MAIVNDKQSALSKSELPCRGLDMLTDYITLAFIAVLTIGFGLILYSKTKNFRLINIVKLEWMIDQFNQSAERTCAAIDNTLEFVEASNKRIEAMEQRASCHRVNKYKQ